MADTKSFGSTIFVVFWLLLSIFSTASFASIITYVGSPSICAGQGLLLTADNPPQGSTFSWLKDGTVIPGATAPTCTATQSGNYIVRVTTAGIDDDSPAVTVTVNPLPDGSFSFTNDNTVSGTTIQFTSTTSAGTAPFSYQWDFGDGQTSINANPSHVYASVGCSSVSYTISLTITDIIKSKALERKEKSISNSKRVGCELCC